MARIHFDENLSAYTTGHRFVCQNQITFERRLLDGDDDGVTPNRV